MLPVRLSVAAVLLGACAPMPASDEPAAVDALPMLEGSPDLDGVVLGDRAGRETIAVVFASWCVRCRSELATISRLLDRPDLRVVGINFRWQEEYDGRGDAIAVRRYVEDEAPWLRVVPADERLFAALGRPPKVPTIYVYDASGRLAAVYDRREREMPDARELAALLDSL